jgi:hypothetical protein
MTEIPAINKRHIKTNQIKIIFMALITLILMFLSRSDRIYVQ